MRISVWGTSNIILALPNFTPDVRQYITFKSYEQYEIRKFHENKIISCDSAVP